MKKALLFSVVAVFAATVVSAEVVESISFNPSRMGKYKQLKVAKQATFPGGLNVTEEMNLRSSGAVTLQYDVANNLTLTDLKGEYPFAKVIFPKVYFQGNGTTVSYDTATGNYSGNVLGTVNLSGGDISFEGGNSYIDSLVDNGYGGGNTIQAESKAFYGNQLAIGTNTSAGAVLADGTTVQGFHLAGNDIPFPRVGEVEHRTTTGAINDVSLNLTNTACTLTWEDRNATIQENGTSTTKAVKVLALSGCDTSTSSACSSDAENSCTNMGGSWHSDLCYCEVSVANSCSNTCPSDQYLTSNCCCEYSNCGKEITNGNIGACKCINS